MKNRIMKNWRRTLPTIIAAIGILIYIALFISDLANGRGMENFGFYLAMIFLLASLFGAYILPPKSSKD